jgi:hypothetical protein
MIMNQQCTMMHMMLWMHAGVGGGEPILCFMIQSLHLTSSY